MLFLLFLCHILGNICKGKLILFPHRYSKLRNDQARYRGKIALPTYFGIRGVQIGICSAVSNIKIF